MEELETSAGDMAEAMAQEERAAAVIELEAKLEAAQDGAGGALQLGQLFR